MKSCQQDIAETRKGFLEKKKKKKKKKTFPRTQPPTPNPARVVILICNASSRPVLHLYHQNIKYSEGCSCNKAETKNQIQTQEGEITPKVKNKTKLSFLYIVWSCSSLLPSTIKIFQRVFDLQRTRNQCIITVKYNKGDNAKSMKGRMSFFYATRHLILFYISTKY